MSPPPALASIAGPINPSADYRHTPTAAGGVIFSACRHLSDRDRWAVLGVPGARGGPAPAVRQH